MKTYSLLVCFVLAAACSEGTPSTRSEQPKSYSGDQSQDEKPDRASPGSKTSRESEVEFTDSTGLVSSYRINLPADWESKSYGLHIHLHGDGGGGYRYFANKEPRHDLIGVVVKAPSSELKWGRELGTPDGNYLNELIQNELLKKYNVDAKRVYFSTVSGGSHFMTGVFIPNYGHLYNSKAFVMCGGIAPLSPFQDPSVLQKFRIHWHTTTGERPDIAVKIQNSIAAYAKAARDMGLSAEQLAKQQSSRVTGAGAHCFFDNKSYKSGIQQEIDKSFAPTLGL